MSNETFWPSVKVRMPAASTAVACTKTSLPPPSGAMKPKPFEVLKNFTVPIVITNFLQKFRPGGMPERVEVGRSKAKEVTVSSRRAHEAGRILLQVRFVCDGSNSSGRDNTRNLSYWQSGH